MSFDWWIIERSSQDNHPQPQINHWPQKSSFSLFKNLQELMRSAFLSYWITCISSTNILVSRDGTTGIYKCRDWTWPHTYLSSGSLVDKWITAMGKLNINETFFSLSLWNMNQTNIFILCIECQCLGLWCSSRVKTVEFSKYYYRDNFR